MKTDDYAYGDLAAFQQWHDRQPDSDPDMHTVRVECVYQFTEYGVFEGRGASTLHVGEHGWFSFLARYQDLDRAAEFANKAPHRFVLQREVYCEGWQ